MKEIRGKSVILLGYGKEGQSTHKYLLEKYPGIKIGIADQRDIVVPQDTQPEIHTGKTYLNEADSYDTIVRSPGIPNNLPELQRLKDLGKWFTTETNIFFSECPGIIIGITGTKGKSTTSSLIHNILKSHHEDTRLVGNIGNPALDALPKVNAQTVFVTELSSYQLQDIRYSPNIAVILAITPEHLNHHGNWESYFQAKSNIVKHQSRKSLVVFNPAHETTTDIVKKSKAKKFPFTIEKVPGSRCYADNGDIYVVGEKGKAKLVMAIKDIPLIGKGNLENTLAAISVGFVIGVPLEKIRKSIIDFKSLPNRLEFVQEQSGIRFYNDSLATTPEAVIHALDALGPDVETLIAGGYDRGLDFSKLGKYISGVKLKTIILFPDTGEKIWAAVLKYSKKHLPQKYNVNSMQEAVLIALEATNPGKICLLSPGSASFNLFQNYEDRGNRFREAIAKTNQSLPR